MAKLLEDFVAITTELNKRGIDYAVCGGWAMAIHGFLRATLDIDLLILTDDFEKARSAAIECGFDIDGLPLNFDQGRTKIRRISKIDFESKQLITLDLILVTEALEDVWAGRQNVTWNQGGYKVVSCGGMIKMKEMAGRNKDLIDLDYLRGMSDEG